MILQLTRVTGQVFDYYLGRTFQTLGTYACHTEHQPHWAFAPVYSAPLLLGTPRRGIQQPTRPQRISFAKARPRIHKYRNQ